MAKSVFLDRICDILTVGFRTRKVYFSRKYGMLE